MRQEKEVISQWSESAPFWVRHRDVIREMFAPITQALIEDAKINCGQTVLDVATGPGEPALSVAKLVGPEGKVIGVDAVPEMVEAARRQLGALDTAGGPDIPQVLEGPRAGQPRRRNSMAKNECRQRADAIVLLWHRRP